MRRTLVWRLINSEQFMQDSGNPNGIAASSPRGRRVAPKRRYGAPRRRKQRATLGLRPTSLPNRLQKNFVPVLQVALPRKRRDEFAERLFADLFTGRQPARRHQGFIL